MTRSYRLGFGIGSALYIGVVAASLIATMNDHNMYSGLLTEPWSMLLGYLFPSDTKARIIITSVIGASLNIVLFYFALWIAYAQSWVAGHKPAEHNTDNTEVTMVSKQVESEPG